MNKPATPPPVGTTENSPPSRPDTSLPLLPLLQAASFPRVAIALGLATGLFALLYALRAVAAPVLAAVGVAYVLLPLARKLQRFGVPRTPGVVIIMGGSFLIGLGAMATIAPIFFAQTSALAKNFPSYVARALAFIRSQLGDVLPHNGAEVFEQAKIVLTKAGPELMSAAGRVFEGGAAAIGAIVTLFLVPLFAFFFLKDWEHFSKALFNLLPEPTQAPIQAKVDQIDRTLSAYLRGVLTVATILAAVYSTGLTILGVPLGLLVGVVAGFAYISPFMSTVIGVSVSILLCLLEFTGWGQIAGVLILFALGNAIEGLFLTPRIVGESLGLPPIAVILAVMLGGSLFGFLGVLLALPVAAVANVIGRDLIALWKTSDAYATGLTKGDIPSA